MMEYRKITNKRAKNEIKHFCEGLKGKSVFEVSIPEIVNALTIPREQVKEVLEDIKEVE